MPTVPIRGLWNYARVNLLHDIPYLIVSRPFLYFTDRTTTKHNFETLQSANGI